MSNSQRGDNKQIPFETSSTDQEDIPDAATLTAFQRDTLAVIATYRPNEWPEERRRDSEPGKPHGLAILAGLEACRIEEVLHGRLYPNLDEMVDEGLVEKHELDKRTNRYQLTSKGRDVLRERQHFFERALDRAESEVE